MDRGSRRFELLKFEGRIPGRLLDLCEVLLLELWVVGVSLFICIVVAIATSENG